MKGHIPESLYQEIVKVIPIATSEVVVIHGGEVLLLKRIINPLKGYWTLPGGCIQLGETPKQAAVRELKEETGIIVSQEDLVSEKVVTYFHPGRQDITVMYAIRIGKTDVVLNEEHNEYAWVSYIRELPNLIATASISLVTIEEINWAFTNKEAVLV